MARRAQYCVSARPKNYEDTWEDWRDTPLGDALYRIGHSVPRIETTGGETLLTIVSRNDYTPLDPSRVDGKTRSDWKYISRELDDLMHTRDVRDVWYISEDVTRFGDMTIRKNLVTKHKLRDRDRAE